MKNVHKHHETNLINYLTKRFVAQVNFVELSLINLYHVHFKPTTKKKYVQLKLIFS